MFLYVREEDEVHLLLQIASVQRFALSREKVEIDNLIW